MVGVVVIRVGGILDGLFHFDFNISDGIDFGILVRCDGTPCACFIVGLFILS